MEQSLGHRRTHQSANHCRAGRRAEDRHVVRVAAEGGDVRLHPLQYGDAVGKRLVAGRVPTRFRGQLWVREKPERTETVVETHEDDALLRERLAVVVRAGTAAFAVGAAEDPHHDRLSRTWIVRRRPDVEIEAVLAHLRRVRQIDGDVVRHTLRLRRLHAYVAELVRFANALPLGDGLRLLPPQVADGWCAERDTLERAHSRLQRDARQLAGCRADRIRDGSRRGDRADRNDRGGDGECEARCFHARLLALSAFRLDAVCFLACTLRARRVDVVANGAIAFMTVVLPPLIGVIETEGITDRVRLHHDDGILDLHLVQDGVVVQPGEPLRRLHLIADREAVSSWRAEDPDVGARRPLFVVGRCDDERVALPAASWFTHVLLVYRFERCAPVGVDDAILVDHLEAEHDHAWRLEDLDAV